MFQTNLRTALKKLAAPALAACALIVFAPAARAQETAATTPTTPAEKAAATTTTTPEPLYKEYKGVTLGLPAAEVRAKLGKPQEKSDEQDFFVFSDSERARVYYDKEKRAHAVIVTYLGALGGAPTPSAVLGADVEAAADGSLYKMVTYPEAGYWLAYSRTAGDSPMVIITMQKNN